MTPWEDLSTLDKLRCMYSDAYKDAMGFRPNYEEVDQWDEYTLRDKINELMDYMQDKQNER